MSQPEDSSSSLAKFGHKLAEYLDNSVSALPDSRTSPATAIMPAAAPVAPAPGFPRSITVTSAPALASRQPTESPATPAPTTTTFTQPAFPKDICLVRRVGAPGQTCATDG